MTALIIILSIIAFILLLLIIPVSIYIDYNGENIKIWLRYLFIKFQLIPQKEKKEKKKKPKKKSEKNPKNEKKEEKEKENPFLNFIEAQGISGVVDILKSIINIVKDFLNYIRTHILIKKLIVNITVAGENAADTAIDFGNTCSMIYPLLGTLSGIVTVCDIPDVNISADYNSKKSKTKLYTVIAVRPIMLLCALVIYGVKAMMLYIKITMSDNKKEENNFKDGANNGKQTTTWRTYGYYNG